MEQATKVTSLIEAILVHGDENLDPLLCDIFDFFSCAMATVSLLLVNLVVDLNIFDYN